MKKIYLLIGLVGLLLSACSQDNSSITHVGTEIVLDNSLGINSYVYPDINTKIVVPFAIRGAANSVFILSRKDSLEYGDPKPVTLTDGGAKIVYTREELGLLEEGDVAWVKIVANSLEREIKLELVSTWLNMELIREKAKEASAIHAGVTFTPIVGNTTKDTLFLQPGIDEWEDISALNWDVKYKIGNSGVEKKVDVAFDARRDSTGIVKVLSEWGASVKDTVYIMASITNKAITRKGEFSFVVKDFNAAIKSKTLVNEDFSSIFNDTHVDTLTLSAEVANKNIARWLSLKDAKWTVNYRTDADPTLRTFSQNPVITTTDTLTVAKIATTFGKLPNVNACDKVFVDGVLEVGTFKYTITHSYNIVK